MSYADWYWFFRLYKNSRVRSAWKALRVTLGFGARLY